MRSQSPSLARKAPHPRATFRLWYYTWWSDNTWESALATPYPVTRENLAFSPDCPLSSSGRLPDRLVAGAGSARPVQREGWNTRPHRTQDISWYRGNITSSWTTSQTHSAWPGYEFQATSWFAPALRAGEAFAKGRCADQQWYDDADGDGYGDRETRTIQCGAPLGTVRSASAHAALLGDKSSGYVGEYTPDPGDLSGDGVADVVYSAASKDDWGFVFLGPVSGTQTSADASATVFGGDPRNGVARHELAVGGDVDGDGTADLVAGSREQRIADGQTGAVFLFLGPTTGRLDAATDAHATIVGENEYDYFGTRVAGPIDFDGDGYADIVTGTPLEDTGGTYAGALYVIYGPVSGTVELSVDHGKLAGGAASVNLGSSLSALGDIDGDGADDVLVGALRHVVGGRLRGGRPPLAGPGALSGGSEVRKGRSRSCWRRRAPPGGRGEPCDIPPSGSLYCATSPESPMGLLSKLFTSAPSVAPTPVYTRDQFRDSVLDAARPVIVNVGSPTCAPCRKLQPELHHIANKYAGRVDIVDIDSHAADPDLVRTLQVRSTPTLIVFENGEELGRMVGFRPRGWFDELIRAEFPDA